MAGFSILKMDFKELGIKQEIIKALSEEDIVEPTDIQAKVIPEIKSGNDIIAISKTGSGKTIAFGSTILYNIRSGQGVQVLIVVPVRELAEQVAREIRKLTKYMKFSTAVVYGGVSLQPQIFQIKKEKYSWNKMTILLSRINFINTIYKF